MKYTDLQVGKIYASPGGRLGIRINKTDSVFDSICETEEFLLLATDFSDPEFQFVQVLTVGTEKLGWTIIAANDKQGKRDYADTYKWACIE